MATRASRGATQRRAQDLHMERLLRVATCLAAAGHGAQVAPLAACARALRADAQLWAAHARHRGPRGRTALMHAALTGSVARIVFLLERGADVDAATRNRGRTALLLACRRGHCEAARVLVERGGANVNAVSIADGRTALMWASAGGHLEIVRNLVDRGGANVNAATTDDGMTALMLASWKGHLEIVHFLVERGGANVNAAMTSHGKTLGDCVTEGKSLATVPGPPILRRPLGAYETAHDGPSAFELLGGAE